MGTRYLVSPAAVFNAPDSSIAPSQVKKLYFQPITFSDESIAQSGRVLLLEQSQ